MNIYSNAFTEVYEILSCLNKEDLYKIPVDVIMAIKNNRNLDYEFAFDENVDLREQHLLLETRAILFNLFRDYLATPKQKEIIIKNQEEERRKNELEKLKKYGNSVKF